MEYKFVPYLFRAQELCESRGGRPGLPIRKSPDGLCGRKATLNLNLTIPREGLNTRLPCRWIRQGSHVPCTEKRVRLAKKEKVPVSSHCIVQYTKTAQGLPVVPTDANFIYNSLEDTEKERKICIIMSKAEIVPATSYGKNNLRSTRYSSHAW